MREKDEVERGVSDVLFERGRGVHLVQKIYGLRHPLGRARVSSVPVQIQYLSK